MSWIHGGDAIPGDGCDTIQERPIRLPDAKIVELPEHLTIMLYDSGLSLRDLPKVSELMAEAYKSGHADGKSDGIQGVLDEPEFYFRRTGQ
jgi:hypothetical protein